jgi:hypothetical protein
MEDDAELPSVISAELSKELGISGNGAYNDYSLPLVAAPRKKTSSTEDNSKAKDEYPDKREKPRPRKGRKRGAETEEAEPKLGGASKRKAKKAAQYERRKGKELQKDSFIQQIQENSLKGAEREMMVRSRDMHQGKSTKKQLSVIMKKHKVCN